MATSAFRSGKGCWSSQSVIYTVSSNFCRCCQCTKVRVKIINNNQWQWANWHCRWNAAEHLSQHSKSPPSLQLSQQSWFGVFPGNFRCCCRSCTLCLLVRSFSVCGGATNRRISYRTSVSWQILTTQSHQHIILQYDLLEMDMTCIFCGPQVFWHSSR